MEKVRLQKFLADAGLLSRRAAEEEIKNGAVTVNGHPATLGTKVDPAADTVVFRGSRVPFVRREHVYIMMNKPRGYLCSTSDDRGRKCVTELLTEVHTRVYPVGRLDLISEGLLLLTDDGELKNRLTHPSHALPKVYRVKVAGEVSSEQLEKLQGAMEIDGYRIRPVTVQITGEDESGTVLKMTLTEGRNRQIRKMCEKVSLTVKRLSRISIGDLKLSGLPMGKWRYLTPEEVAYLRRATAPKKL